MKIRRILVALDASAHSVAALDAATAMAAAMRAELRGVFVEDIDLVRLAELPCACELVYPLASRREIDRILMEHSFKEMAEKARQSLAEIASRAGVHWTFEVRRGQVLRELLAMTSEVDAIAIGRAGQERTRRARLGSTAIGILTGAPRVVMLMQQGEYCHAPALVVCDGSEDSLREMDSALELARAMDGPPIILLIAEDQERAQELRVKIIERPLADGARFRRCKPSEIGGVARISHEEEIGTVIVAGLPRTLGSEGVKAIIDRIECPVIIVRDSPSEKTIEPVSPEQRIE